MLLITGLRLQRLLTTPAHGLSLTSAQNSYVISSSVTPSLLPWPGMGTFFTWPPPTPLPSLTLWGGLRNGSVLPMLCPPPPHFKRTWIQVGVRDNSNWIQGCLSLYLVEVLWLTFLIAYVIAQSRCGVAYRKSLVWDGFFFLFCTIFVWITYRFQKPWTVLWSMRHPVDSLWVGAWNSVIIMMMIITTMIMIMIVIINNNDNEIKMIII